MDLLSKIATGSLQAESLPDDYTEDGILYCGNCHTAKEYEYEIKAGARVIKGKGAVMCKCEQSRLDELERKNKELDFQYWKQKMLINGLGKSKYQTYTFENDDQANPEITKMCKAYVKNFAKAKKEKLGLLFYGTVGTGKTYYAVAIANALIEKQETVKVTSITEWINSMQTFDEGNKQKALDDAMRASLLIIDDVGSERDTPFGLEQAYMLVDGRYNSGLPTIATTNNTLEELRNPINISYRRIYDRILEMCSTPIEVTGVSRRKAIQDEKELKAMEILGLLDD